MMQNPMQSRGRFGGHKNTETLEVARLVKGCRRYIRCLYDFQFSAYLLFTISKVRRNRYKQSSGCKPRFDKFFIIKSEICLNFNIRTVTKRHYFVKVGGVLLFIPVSQ